MTAKRLVFFENWVDPAAEELLKARSDIEVKRLTFAAPQDGTWAEMARAQAYQILPRTELRKPWFGNAALLARSPNLLAISSTGAGYDMVDVEACTAAGVIVCNQSGTNSQAVAEHALGLMLALANNIVTSDRDIRRVPGLDRWAYTGVELMGKTVGIIGIGQIGKRTAKICGQGFGMTVLAYDPYLTDAEIAARGAKKVDLDELMRRSDFVSVHCPRTKETFGMLGKAQFALMKPTAYFITTARGGVHKEDDLLEILKAKRIAGAGLDVFLDEPPALDHPLLKLDTVIATPHVAGASREALRAMATAAAEQWIDIFAGKVPPRLVNPKAWPRYMERFKGIFGKAPEALPS